MTRQALKQLVIQSHTDGELDATKVNRIVDLLSKSELKLYIKSLKNWERQHSVTIDVPFDDAVKMSDIEGMFDKSVTVRTDPSILLGMRIQENDDVYELSLKNTLRKITKHIEEQYD